MYGEWGGGGGGGGRCHFKHRTSQYMMTDSPSSDSLSAEMSQPATNPGKHSNHVQGGGSRCHLKHRTSQYMMTDSPSSDSLSAEMSQPATNPGKHSNHVQGGGVDAISNIELVNT